MPGNLPLLQEDNMELMKRMRALTTERTRLMKKYRALKDTHVDRCAC